MEQRIELTLTNSHTEQLTLRIEPWAEEMAFPCRAKYKIAAEGPAGYCVEVDFAEKAITVYGWPGSILSVFEGQKALCKCLIEAPPLPRADQPHPSKAP